MKILSDLLPVLLFFATYWFTRDIFSATAVAIVATAIAVGYAYFRHRKVDTMQWVSLALIVVLGGATLLLHDKQALMWKPTLLYWAMGGGLLLGQFAGKNGIRALMKEQVVLPDAVWTRLNLAWIAFFAFMGTLNLWVAFSFSEETWVNFKLFGGMGLMFAFVVAQSFYLTRHMENKE